MTRHSGVCEWGAALPLAAVSSLSFWTTSAFGQDTNAAPAEQLFREARQLLNDGSLAEACPKFAESLRLDPATGTLLGLAICHEREGKLASAWAEYNEVAARARREGDAERMTFASDAARALEPRLSTLTIAVPEALRSLAGFTVKRDGVAVGDASWGLAVPLDGGPHTVEASAPGKEGWSHTVTLASEAGKETVTIEPLKDAQAVAPSEPPPLHAPGSSTKAEAEPWYGEMNTLRWVGVGCAGAGVVSLGVGGYFLSSALDADAESEAYCVGDACNRQGRTLRDEATEDGASATALGVAGAVLLAGGVTLFFVAEEDPLGEATLVQLTAQAGPGGFVSALTGRF